MFKLQFWATWQLPFKFWAQLAWWVDFRGALFMPHQCGRSFGFRLRLIGLEVETGFWFRTMSLEVEAAQAAFNRETTVEQAQARHDALEAEANAN